MSEYTPPYWAQVQAGRDKHAKAEATVREKGRKAKREGLQPASCPYPDTRKADGRLTFSRHWRKLWFEGYNE